MPWHVPQTLAGKIKLCLDRIALLLFLPTSAALVAEYGFHLTQEWSTWLHRYELGTAVFFALSAWIRLALASHRTALLRRRWLTYLLSLLPPLLLLILLVPNLGWLANFFEKSGFTTAQLTTVCILFFQCYIALELLRLLGHSLARFAQSRIKPASVAVITFAALILLGTFALMLPKSTEAPITLTDAFFTSTSAVSVTGLTVMDTGLSFTFTGEVILLALIQIGGLGIMTLAACVVVFFGGSMGFRERVTLQDLVQANVFDRISDILLRITAITFFIEAIGAVTLWFIWKETVPDPLDRAGMALFHSVSAFCNAGFTNVEGGLAHPLFSQNWPSLTTLALLVILGGIGIPTLVDLFHLPGRRQVKGLHMQTKVILYANLFLLLAGTIAFLMAESGNYFTGKSGIEKGLSSFFLAVMPRTAGFQTMEFSALTPFSIGIITLLMVIGGSPGSTAGGLKVTTIATVLVYFKSLIYGDERIRLFNREISETLCARAMALCLLYGISAVTATLILVSAENVKTPGAFFEVISALSTVGLSVGVSAELGPVGKWTLILCMFAGRLGILSVLWSLFHRERSRDCHYPQENIMLY